MLLAALAALGAPTRYELLPYEPLAAPESLVRVGDAARFTVLTSRLLRLEYDENGRFEDRPSLTFPNRRLPVPRFKVRLIAGGGVSITTAHLELRYGGGRFTADSLRVTAAPASVATPGGFVEWVFGQDSVHDKGNLRGTIRTLDELDNVTLACGAHAPDAHCAAGLVSRSGWALVDDSGAPVLDDKDDWWTALEAPHSLLRSRSEHDFYLFAHGADFRGALRDYSRVAGRAPLPARRNLGVWFTRWYDYSSSDVRGVVEELAGEGVPLDVLSLDMNWHSKFDWTGYSWDRQLFPFPADTLGWLRERGVGACANLHDASGVLASEERFGAFCAALGLDPQRAGSAVPFDLTNRSYAHALSDELLLPLQDDGIVSWWIDWQQGEGRGGTGQDERGRMNPTIWLNKLRETDGRRRCARSSGQGWRHGAPAQGGAHGTNGRAACDNERRLPLGRWGGLGTHRYAHGFSGDVKSLTWANMAYQAYFSAAAANVGFHWSHDLVGPAADPELQLRWTQLVALSSLTRLHERGLSAGPCASGWPADARACAIVEPTRLAPAWRRLVVRALRRRASLVPYLSTAARLAFDEGLPAVRPMYFAFPRCEQAYPASHDALLGQLPSSSQYFLGDSLLVAPVTRKAADPCAARALDAPCALSEIEVWLPPGDWLEVYSGRLLAGPATLRRWLHASETPIYVPVGRALPLRELPPSGAPALGLAAQELAHVHWLVVAPLAAQQAGRRAAATEEAGGWEGSGAQLYEDDGRTTDYLNDMAAASSREDALDETAREQGHHGATAGGSFSAWTQLQHSWRVAPAGGAAGAELRVRLWTRGKYAALPPSRPYSLRLRNLPPPSRVTYCEAARGAPDFCVQPAGAHSGGHASAGEGPPAAVHVPFARWPVLSGGTHGIDGSHPAQWSYDGERLELLVHLPPLSPDHVWSGAETRLAVEFGAGALPSSTLSGARLHLSRAALAKRNLDETRSVQGGSVRLSRDQPRGGSPPASPLSVLASAGDALSHLAGSDVVGFAQLLARIQGPLFDEAIAQVQSLVASARTDELRARFAYSRSLLTSVVDEQAALAYADGSDACTEAH